LVTLDLYLSALVLLLLALLVKFISVLVMHLSVMEAQFTSQLVLVILDPAELFSSELAPRLIPHQQEVRYLFLVASPHPQAVVPLMSKLPTREFLESVVSWF